jgi:serine/threonine-protein kinase
MFMMDTISATLAAAAAGQTIELASVRPDIEPALEEIVQKALARDRNQRYQTAAELHEALEGYLRGRVRPNPKEIANWLQGAFGEGRANLKKSIARGINLQIGYEQLVALNEDLAKALSTASSSVGSHRLVTREQGKNPRPLWHVMLFGAVAATVVAIGVLFASSPIQETVELPRRSGSLTLRSEPPGALIFLGGEPTGKRTPSTLEGLPADRPVEVEVQLSGRGKASTSVTLKAGDNLVRSLRINSGGQ